MSRLGWHVRGVPRLSAKRVLWALLVALPPLTLAAPQLADAQNRALRLGDGGYIKVPESAVLQIGLQLTLEAWVRSDSVGVSPVVALVPAGSLGWAYAYLLANDGGRPTLAAWSAGREYQIAGEDTLRRQVWYHLAATVDGDSARVYVNGQRVAAGPVWRPATVAAAGWLLLGSNDAGGGLYGTMDELRVWGVARSAAEIQAAMFAPLSGSEPGLVAYYPFDARRSDGWVLDASGHGLDGEPSPFARDHASALALEEAGPLTSYTRSPVLAVTVEAPVILVTEPERRIPLRLSNPGNTALPWSIRTEDPWIGIERTINGATRTEKTWGGSLGVDERVDLTIVVAAAGLAQGAYEGRLRIVSDAGRREVTIGLQVGRPEPYIAADAGRALLLDEATGHVLIDDPQDLFARTRRFAMEMWVRVDDLARTERIMASSQYGVVFDQRDSTLMTCCFEQSRTGGLVEAPRLSTLTSVRQGEWHHVAYAADSLEQHLWLDGVQETPPVALGRGSAYQFDAAMQIGAVWSFLYPQWGLHGAVDEVRIWNRPLSEAEVQAHLNGTLTGAEDGLILYYTFDATDGFGRLPDLSGHGHWGHLSETGASLVPSGAPIKLPGGRPLLAVDSATVDVPGTPAGRVLPMRNAGIGVLTWTVAEDADWLTVGSARGSTAGDTAFSGQGALPLSLYTSGRGLAPGTYETHLRLRSNGGDLEIPVRLRQEAEPSPGRALPAGPGQAFAAPGNHRLYVDPPRGLTALSEVTVEAWVQIAEFRPDACLLHVGGGTWDRFGLWLGSQPDQLVWQVNSVRPSKAPEARAEFAVPLPVGAYRHLAVTHRGDHCTLYVDGQRVAEKPSARLMRTGASAVLGVGMKADLASSGFVGQIDELRIWDRALAQDEIEANLHRPLRGNEPHLVVYYSFDELVDSLYVRDLSGSGNDGRTWATTHAGSPQPLARSEAPVGTVSSPVIAVRPAAMAFAGPAPAAQELTVSNAGTGVLTWSARSLSAWLTLAVSEADTPTDRLEGEGPARLRVLVQDQGLAAGTYDGVIRCEAGSDSVDLPVTLTVPAGPPLGPHDAVVPAGQVPAGAFGTAFAISVAQALDVDLVTVATALAPDSPTPLHSVRVVATRSDGVVYVAAEAAISGHDPRLMARVWTSADRGASWHLLLGQGPDPPGASCAYGARVRGAALHPDGRRVYLATTNGLFLDDRPVTLPPQASAVTAVHVTADGRFLWLATEDLSALCEWPTRTLSVRAVYRTALGDETALSWADATSGLTRALTPLAGLGSDDADPELLYLLSPSRVVYRSRLRTAAEAGWRTLSRAAVPAGVDFEQGLTRAEAQLRVQPGYPGAWTPSDRDVKWSWLGFLFGRDGLAWAHCSGSFSHLEQELVLQSRDAGVTWQAVFGRGGFGWGLGDVEPYVLAVDAAGAFGVNGSSVTGIPAVGVGPWNTDPIDPLTTYVGLAGRGVVYRTPDHGATWEGLGDGLSPTLSLKGIAIDSVGSLYVQTGQPVYVRQVADRSVQVAEARVVPETLAPGDPAVVTARVRPLAGAGTLPSDLRVSVVFAPGEGALPLRDDGATPDRVAGDGVWSGAVAVPAAQSYGAYGAVVAAAPLSRPAARASRRAPFRVAPVDDQTVYADSAGEGWTCSDAAGGAVASAQHAGVGQAPMRVEGEVTCRHEGPALHPYGRQLELLAFAEGAPAHLRVQDYDVASDSLPAGRWTRLRLPAEALPGGPGGTYGDPQPPDLSVLRFFSPSPILLDDVRLVAARTEPATAVTQPAAPPRPQVTVLWPARPNPFNSSTIVPFELARDGQVRLAVYDLLGQLVRQIHAGWLPAGRHTVSWDGRANDARPLATGAYLLRLEGAGEARVRKVLLVR